KGNEIRDIGWGKYDEVVDTRKKVVSLDKKAYAYPYTIEFSYVTQSSNMMFYALWYPYENENTSVQTSSFTVIAPENIPFRMKEIAITQPAEIITKSGKKYYTWKLENLPAYEEEPNSPKGIHPRVL